MRQFQFLVQSAAYGLQLKVQFPFQKLISLHYKNSDTFNYKNVSVCPVNGHVQKAVAKLSDATGSKAVLKGRAQDMGKSVPETVFQVQSLIQGRGGVVHVHHLRNSPDGLRHLL